MVELRDRYDFVRLGVLFELVLIGLAFVIGLLVDVNPLATFRTDATAWWWGVGATVPLLGVFVLCQRIPWEPLRLIQDFLMETLGEPLRGARWYDILVVALMAGIGEEIFFRGLLQVCLGLWISSLLFGLVHWVTPTYAVIAFVLSLALGALHQHTGNLLSPIVTHSLYDFIGLLLLARDARRQGPPSDADE